MATSRKPEKRRATPADALLQCRAMALRLDPAFRKAWPVLEDILAGRPTSRSKRVARVLSGKAGA